MSVLIKRAYEKPEPGDGTRILVDRLWPRGLTKAKAQIDVWLKEIAPSTELRKWFAHDASKWSEFKRRYRAELKQHAAELETIQGFLKQGPVTLVYAAKDEAHNEAIVLQERLNRSSARRSGSRVPKRRAAP